MNTRLPTTAAVLVAALAGSAFAIERERPEQALFDARWYSVEVAVFRYRWAKTDGPERVLLRGVDQAPRLETLREQASAHFGEPFRASMDPRDDTAEDAPAPIAVMANTEAVAMPAFQPATGTEDAATLAALLRSNARQFESYLAAVTAQVQEAAPTDDDTGEANGFDSLLDPLIDSGLAEILLHNRWYQPVPPRDEGVTYQLAAGAPEQIAGYRWHPLEGDIELTLGRYLHANVHFYYYPDPEPLPAMLRLTAPSPVPASPRRAPPVRDLSAGDPATPLERPPRPNATAGTPETGSAALQFELPAYAALEQRRRLRSGELHYLDHPLIGVLLRVNPVPLPAPLDEQFRRLQELEDQALQ